MRELFAQYKERSVIENYYAFTDKSGAKVIIKLIEEPENIDQMRSKEILIESFIGEYEKYLEPSDISKNCTSWHSGELSVLNYYSKYFDKEFSGFKNKSLNYWIEATIDGLLVGWATFQKEKKLGEIYMNLLVMSPEYRRRSIGKELVFSLTRFKLVSSITKIHLLLRRKNRAGRQFYTAIGFNENPGYQRDNYVDSNLLEGLTYSLPSSESTQRDTICGFEPGFLTGKRF